MMCRTFRLMREHLRHLGSWPVYAKNSSSGISLRQ
jgi:hypothetical protein